MELENNSAETLDLGVPTWDSLMAGGERPQPAGIQAKPTQ